MTGSPPMLSLSVGKAQLQQVCRLLGLDPNLCVRINMTPQEVTAELYVRDNEGHIKACPSSKKPLTREVTMRVV